MISVQGNLNQVVNATHASTNIIEATTGAVVNSVQVNIGGGLKHLVEDVVAFGAKETPDLVDKFGKKLEAIKPKEVPLSSIMKPEGGFYPLLEPKPNNKLLKNPSVKEGLSTKGQVKDSPNFKAVVQDLDHLKVAEQHLGHFKVAEQNPNGQLKVALQKPPLSVTDSISNNAVNQSTVNEVKAKLSTLEQQIIDAQKAQDWDKVSQLAQTMKKLQARLDELNAPVVSSGEVKGSLLAAAAKPTPIDPQAEAKMLELAKQAEKAAESADWGAFVNLNNEIAQLTRDNPGITVPLPKTYWTKDGLVTFEG